MESLFLTLLIPLVLAFSEPTGYSKLDQPSSLLIRVTSVDGESEATVQCAYIIDGEDRTLQIIEKTTPFEIQIKGKICYALLRQKSQEGAMSAKLYTLGKEKWRSPVGGSGRAIVIGYRELEDEGSAPAAVKEGSKTSIPSSFIAAF